MNFTAVQLAYQSIRRQPTRSVLTILGISLGIAIVIVIMAAGGAIQGYISSQLDVYSPNTLSIEVKVPSAKRISAGSIISQSTGVTITTLKEKDLNTILAHPNVEAAYTMLTDQEIVSYNGQIKKVMFLANGAAMPEVEKVALQEGRFYTRDEENSLSALAILGSKVKEKFFDNESAVGKIIYVRGKPFKVIGVFAPRGSAFFFDWDNMISIPTKTMQKKLLGIDYYLHILAKTKDGARAEDTARDLTELIRLNHNITDPRHDDFLIHTMAEARSLLNSVTEGIVFLLVALVCISLLVGGVGIMNIMYVSVTERTFEIGLRKAVGARRHDILKQFLSEAILLTISGGVAGIILGALLALIIYLVAIYYGLNWVYSIPISSIFLAVGFSAFVGLLFGIYPARKAANLNPIEALRKE